MLNEQTGVKRIFPFSSGLRRPRTALSSLNIGN